MDNHLNMLGLLYQYGYSFTSETRDFVKAIKYYNVGVFTSEASDKVAMARLAECYYSLDDAITASAWIKMMNYRGYAINKEFEDALNEMKNLKKTSTVEIIRKYNELLEMEKKKKRDTQSKSVAKGNILREWFFPEGNKNTQSIAQNFDITISALTVRGKAIDGAQGFETIFLLSPTKWLQMKSKNRKVDYWTFEGEPKKKFSKKGYYAIYNKCVFDIGNVQNNAKVVDMIVKNKIKKVVVSEDICDDDSKISDFIQAIVKKDIAIERKPRNSIIDFFGEN